MPHLEMYHALLDFQGWEERVDSQGTGADPGSYPRSLQRRCGHGTAALIVRGAAPAHQHQQIGQLPTQASSVSKYRLGWGWFCWDLAGGTRKRQRFHGVGRIWPRKRHRCSLSAAERRSWECCADTEVLPNSCSSTQMSLWVFGAPGMSN